MSTGWKGTTVEVTGGTLACVALTPERWDDLAALFGPRGAQSGCWCMYWRKPGKAWSDNDANREAFHQRVGQRPPPGVLGVLDGATVGWAQIAPREEFGRLLRSRHLGPRQPAAGSGGVWSLNCFVIHRRARRRGVASGLVTGALAFARHHGAAEVEAYPVDRAQAASGELYTGTPGMFERAGFTEVARRHPSRPILRIEL